LQKSIEDVVRERIPAQVGRQIAQTQSGRPRRVKRRRMSDRGGKIARLAWAEVLASISATGSARKAFGDERGP
jgi:hypothetical protein